MAIDRPTLVQRALNGYAVASSGPIWPRYWALPSPSPWFEFDPRRASEIVNGGQHELRIPAVRFTCLTLADPVYERIALELKRQFQAIGVEMDVRETTPDQLIEAERKGTFDAVLFDVISAPTLLRVYLMWYSRSEGNPGAFGNPSVDAALDRVTAAETDASYRQAVAGLQQAFLDDPPAIFLAWQQRARAISKRFAVPPPEAGRDVLGTIRLWSPRNNDARFASRN
jgi:ABC-type transport system substrate-binding protein